MRGNKTPRLVVSQVDVPWWVLNPNPFEEPAMPHFDQLYNFANWLT
jgi:hypothetical protein